MSLVNQMLKDLDARRGPANSNHTLALRGLGLVDSGRTDTRLLLIFAGWSLAALLVVFAGYQAVNWWLEPKPASGIEFLASPAMSGTSERPGETAPIKAATPREAEHAPTPTPEPDSPPGASAVEQVIVSTNQPRQTAAPRTEPPSSSEPLKPVKNLSAQQKADALFDQAQRALGVQDYLKGESLLRQALFEYPRYHSARVQLAALLEARNNNAAAERLLAQGLAEHHQELELARPYAQLLAARGDIGAALAALNIAIGGQPVDAQTYALRAALLDRDGQHAEAARDYRRALKQQPGKAVWWVGLAIAEEHNAQFIRALSAYRRADRMPLDSTLRDYVTQRISALQLTDGN